MFNHIIKLNENQLHKLFEATDGKFNTSELSAIPSYRGRVSYCVEHLGKWIGNGSSRIVFQIDDEKVIKLAKNKKGVAQNGVENDYYKQKLDIFPKNFECDNNGLWIVCEYVLPAKKRDFQQCLGVSFDEFCRFVYATFERTNPRGNWSYRAKGMTDERYGELIENDSTGFFMDVEDYLINYNVANMDITALRNWGLAKRDGEAFPVLLDHGLNDEVYNTYYRR